MKCIHCQSNTPNKIARATSKCSSCLHRFAFTGLTQIDIGVHSDVYGGKSQERPPAYANHIAVTDMLFQKAIHAVSSNGKYAFTCRQLYYEFLRRLPAPANAGCATAMGIVALVPLMLAMGIAGPSGGSAQTKVAGPPMTFDTFTHYYFNQWVRIHGEPEGLVDANPVTTTPTPVLPELLNYSFDRCLIVDNADIAAMLVANRFHFENNCAILSADGAYPAPDRRDAIMTMLGRNPELVVAYLHDASAGAFASAANLRSADWFGDRRIWIADIGLTPRQAWAQRLFVENSTYSNVDTRLPSDELDWLQQGYMCSLSGIRPAKLLKTAYMGLTEASRMSYEEEYDTMGGVFLMGYMWSPVGYAYHDTGFSPWMAGGDTAAFDASAPDSFG